MSSSSVFFHLTETNDLTDVRLSPRLRGRYFFWDFGGIANSHYLIISLATKCQKILPQMLSHDFISSVYHI